MRELGLDGESLGWEGFVVVVMEWWEKLTLIRDEVGDVRGIEGV